jgi:hypothetical protein
MINVKQFREYIVNPALMRLEPAIPWSLAAENLVIGTAIHESKLTYVDQLAPGAGPAYGPFQMEKFTYDDLWSGYIAHRPELKQKLLAMAGFDDEVRPPVIEMYGNFFYAAAMCRVFYRSRPGALPAPDDIDGLARYAKKYYNTELGKATIEDYAKALRIGAQSV